MRYFKPIGATVSANRNAEIGLFTNPSGVNHAMKENIKEKILAAGASIIHRKGYNHTGIQEVLQTVGVPKGSFYFYFKNKEDFGLQVVDYFVSFFSAQASPVLNDKGIPPLERMKKFLEEFKVLFKEMNYECGCPLGNLAQEMGDLSPAFRSKLKDSLDLMINLYANVLSEAKQSGDISKDLDIQETAGFIVSSWHGALIRMKIEKSDKPLDNHIRFIFNHILK